MEGKGKRERFCLEFVLGVRSRFEKKNENKIKKREEKYIFFIKKKRKRKVHEKYDSVASHKRNEKENECNKNRIQKTCAEK